jgi:hypothetical protein
MDPTFCDYETLRLQQMTVGQKLAALKGLRQRAIALTEAGVRIRHPDWTPVQWL